MRFRSLFLLPFVGIFLIASGCKSEFEKIRASGDSELLYKKAFEYYEGEEYQKAQTLFELVVGSYRGKKEAEEIYFKYAYTYYYLNRYIMAAYYFKNFSQTYSTSEYREESDFMTAYSNYMMSPSFRLDQSYSQEAIDAFQLFINTYPNSDRVAECNRLIDELRKKQEMKAFDEGKLYFDLRHYQAAMHSFENLLKDFPDSDNAEEIRYMIIGAAFLLAENSIVDKKEERYADVIEKANEYLKRYSDSKNRKEVNSIFEKSQKKQNQLTNVGYQK